MSGMNTASQDHRGCLFMDDGLRGTSVVGVLQARRP